MISKGNLTRYLKYLEQSDFFYFYVLLFCILLFGIGGILPLSINMFKKLTTIKEMTSVISKFNEKERVFTNIQNEYADINPYLYYLDIYMPEDINVDDYLVSLNAVAVNNGFAIKRLSPKGDEVNNSQELIISTDGYGDLPVLIKDIEALKRVTKINSLDILKVKGKERIDLGIQIFSR